MIRTAHVRILVPCHVRSGDINTNTNHVTSFVLAVPCTYLCNCRVPQKPGSQIVNDVAYLEFKINEIQYVTIFGVIRSILKHSGVYQNCSTHITLTG